MCPRSVTIAFPAPVVRASHDRRMLTHPAHGIPIGHPAAGVTGHLSRTALSAEITGRSELDTRAAEPGSCKAVAKLGGFVLIVTQAADPHQLTPNNSGHGFPVGPRRV
jgi:hypothetical protein